MDEYWSSQEDDGLAECERYEFETDYADLLLRDSPNYIAWLEAVELNRHNEVLH